jgi:hypothetical protein
MWNGCEGISLTKSFVRGQVQERLYLSRTIELLNELNLMNCK